MSAHPRALKQQAKDSICLNRSKAPAFPGRAQEISITTSFASLGLNAELQRAVAEQGYTAPTPIQAQAIPVVLAGRDLLGAAQTGTGKTAGFTLPLLQRLAAKATTSHSPARHPVRALIVTPTRELAAQVEESVRTYGKYLNLRSTCIFGGVNMNPQTDDLRRGIDIVVATPGRLLDHVDQKSIDLRQVEILVLDEADRMLDMGFIHDIRRILALLPEARQNLLFSATFPDEIRKLAASFMKDPATVEVARRNTPAELVAQVAHPVTAERKRELLVHLVKTNDWRQVLVFARTKHGANRLAGQLERSGIEADAIHGNKSQNARIRALARFKDNELRVLVATDIAARGLDIEALPHVVNYDLPYVAEDYVHRIGRTGRAGAEGEAVSLVTPEEQPLLAAIEKLMNRKVEQRIVPGFEPGSAAAAPKPANDRKPQRSRPPRQKHGRPQPQANNRNPRPPRGPRPMQALPDTSERDAQIAEARARMMAEGEVQPMAAAAPTNGSGAGNGMRGNGRSGNGRSGNGAEGPRRSKRRRGRGGEQRARGRRPGAADPRRAEAMYAEPRERGAYPPSRHSEKPRPAPVVQVKPRRSIAGFFGALLGRKNDDDKS